MKTTHVHKPRCREVNSYFEGESVGKEHLTLQSSLNWREFMVNGQDGEDSRAHVTVLDRTVWFHVTQLLRRSDITKETPHNGISMEISGPRSWMKAGASQCEASVCVLLPPRWHSRSTIMVRTGKSSMTQRLENTFFYWIRFLYKIASYQTRLDWPGSQL